MRIQRAAACVLTLAATAACGAPDAATPVSAAPPPTATRSAEPVAPERPGWQVVADHAAAVTYEVPPRWTLAEDTETLESSSGVELAHLADFGPYLCQGAEYGRAFSGSGVTAGDPAETAAELAASIAADQYSDGTSTATVTVSTPTPVTRHGARGTVVLAAAKVDGAADRCASTQGTVAVVAIATAAGTAVVVVAADADTGSTPSATLVGHDDLLGITDSVRPMR